MKDSSDKKVKQLEQKIKELERMVGQKQIKIDYLVKMIEIADVQPPNAFLVASNL